MSEYIEQAERFMQENGLEFRAVLVGSDCPSFCEDAEKERDMDEVNTFPRRTHIHGKHYRCTISRKGKGHISIDFWNSYADEYHNWLRSFGFSSMLPSMHALDDWKKARLDKSKRTVTPYDLLACITKSDPGNFENFCADFGYDADSRKAEAVYQAVLKEWQKVRGFFTDAELEALQEIA